MSDLSIAVGTIVARNFLCFARVLASSLKRHHPDVPFVVVVTDDPDGRVDPEHEPFEIVRLEALRIPNLERLCFKYTRQQLTIAIKPFLLAYLLDRGFGTAIFLDADILVTASLAPLFDASAAHAIVLTPHTIEPLIGCDGLARELNLLLSGAYNGGFIGVSDRPSARAFIDWWADRLSSHCLHDVGSGLHFDQRWLDLVPHLFDDVHVVRDAGCDVAYWNLPERSIQVDALFGECGAMPCRFFHFSGFEPDKPTIVTRYSSRVPWNDLGSARRLFEEYVHHLKQAGMDETLPLPHGHGFFSDGTPIPDIARRMYASLGVEASRFGDPFLVDGTESFLRWLTEPMENGRPISTPITRLWQCVYRERPDLQTAFPDLDNTDREAFVNWTSTSGLTEHEIPAVLGLAR